MVTILAFLLGAAIGFWRSTKRGGNTGDRIQWALAHGVIFALLAMIIITVLLHLAG